MNPASRNEQVSKLNVIKELQITGKMYVQRVAFQELNLSMQVFSSSIRFQENLEYMVKTVELLNGKCSYGRSKEPSDDKENKNKENKLTNNNLAKFGYNKAFNTMVWLKCRLRLYCHHRFMVPHAYN